MLIVPVSVDIPLRRRPYVNYFIIVLNVFVFLFMFPSGREWASIRDSLALWTPPDPRFQLHQLVTSAFLHAGWLHIMVNMFFVWVFGNKLNDRLGHLRYLLFYLCAAAVSGAAQVLTSAPGTWCVGASGAMSAVVGGFLVLYPLSDVKIFYWLIVVAGFAYVRSLYLVASSILFNVLMSIWRPQAGIAYSAHLAGYAMGIATLLVLIGTGRLTREGADLIAWLRRRLPDGRPWRMRYIPVDATTGMFRGVRHSGKAVDPGRAHAFAAPEFADTEEVLHGHLVHAVAVGDMETALGIYEQVTAANPGSLLPLRTLVTVGNWYLRSERHPEAVEAWRRAVAQHPDHRLIPTVRFSIGMVLGRYRDEPEAALAELTAVLPALDSPERARIAPARIAWLRRRV